MNSVLHALLVFILVFLHFISNPGSQNPTRLGCRGIRTSIHYCRRLLILSERGSVFKAFLILIKFRTVAQVNVAMMLMLMLGISAVLGLQLFSGLFYSCNDVTVSGVEECTGTFTNSAGEETSRIWSRPFYNFDSFGNSLMALFVTSTLDGYQIIMESAIAAPVAKGMQPVPGSQKAAAIFFVLFIVIAVFVLLNLFVGALLSVVQVLCVASYQHCLACRSTLLSEISQCFVGNR